MAENTCSTVLELNALTGIFKWSQSLPAWQSDALRRLLQNNELTAKDFEEILGNFKSEIGLTDAKSSALRLQESDTPKAGIESADRIILIGIRDLKNVNAIKANDGIRFAEKGATIIYGKNASGKSGYARILKKACRARGPKDRILPDVFTSLSADPAQASILYRKGEKEDCFSFVDGREAMNELASISVFDTNCVRIYTDQANEVAYAPYGLDVFDKLSKVCDQIKTTLQNELNGIKINENALNRLRGTTQVGTLINSLSADSDFSKIEKLSILSTEETKRLEELETKIREIKANNPKDKAEELRQKKRRIEKVYRNLEFMDGILEKRKIEECKTLHKELLAAKGAAEIASKRSFEGEPLPGIGTASWKLLFNAAKQYSEQAAYMGKPFPVIDDDARCVLCLQTLDSEAKDRLERFYGFIENKTEKQLRDAKNAYDSKIQGLLDVKEETYKIDDDLQQEINRINSETGSSTTAFFKKSQEILIVIKEFSKIDKWDEVVPFLPEAIPLPGLKKIIDDIELAAKEFDEASKEGLAPLEQECAELTARKKLAEEINAVKSVFDDFKKQKNLKEALRFTDTGSISRKSKELMGQLITEKLKTALKNEFSNLDIDYLKIDLNKIGRSGVTLHQFKLQSGSHSSTSLSEVFSEGEQRALALASFLAELETSNDASGIIFDDPVSSLDHNRRERVAKRLIEESKRRQVIIFTHDIVFLQALHYAAEKSEADFYVSTLWGNPARGAGHCDPSFPWIAKSAAERKKYLLGHSLPKLQKLYKEHPQSEEYKKELCDFFEKLRETWERVIEDCILNESIKRFRDSVETKRLQAVKFEDNDYAMVDKFMTKTSNFLHDRAPAKGEIDYPTPLELEQDLKELDEYMKQIEKRNKETKDRR